MHILQLCLLPGPSSERPERKEQQGLLSPLDPWYLWPERRALFLPSFRGKPLNCSAIVYHFCATVVLPRGWAPRWGNTPKRFSSIFLTQDRLFSCSSDKKERAYLGAFSVCIYYKLLNFRLPLSSGWETLYFKKREIHPQFSGSQSLSVFPNIFAPGILSKSFSHLQGKGCFLLGT